MEKLSSRCYLIIRMVELPRIRYIFVQDQITGEAPNALNFEGVQMPGCSPVCSWPLNGVSSWVSGVFSFVGQGCICPWAVDPNEKLFRPVALYHSPACWSVLYLWLLRLVFFLFLSLSIHVSTRPTTLLPIAHFLAQLILGRTFNIGEVSGPGFEARECNTIQSKYMIGLLVKSD